MGEGFSVSHFGSSLVGLFFAACCLLFSSLSAAEISGSESTGAADSKAAQTGSGTFNPGIHFVPFDDPTEEKVILFDREKVQSLNLFADKGIFASPFEADPFSADALFSFEVFERPTGAEFFNQFNLNQLDLGFKKSFFKEDQKASFWLLLGLKQKTDNNLYPVAARLRMENVFSNAYTLDFGILPNPLRNPQPKAHQLERLDFGFWSMLIRYNYVPESDYGLSVTNTDESKTRLQFWITNGEGAKSKESGPRKDAGLFYASSFGEDFIDFSLYLQHGYWEKVDSKKSARDRGQLIMGIRPAPDLRFSVEGFLAQDAVDGVLESLSFAPKLEERGGEIAHAQGLRLSVDWQFGGLSQDAFWQTSGIKLLTENWDPDNKIKKNSLNRHLLGWYFLAGGLDFLLSMESLDFEEQFAPGKADQLKYLLQIGASF